MSQRQKRKLIAIAIACADIAIVVGIFLIPTQKTIEVKPVEDKEMARAIETAQEFLATSPTFAFDGITDSVTIVQPTESLVSNPIQYKIQLSFDSRHVGYGNRANQVLAEIITHHIIEIIVSDGKVTSATIDKNWDELKQIYSSQPAGSTPLQITTNKEQYKSGEAINITITNQGNTRLFPKGWGYSVTGIDGQQYAPSGVLKMMLVALSSGESIHWVWEQTDGNGTQVNAGKYRIVGSYIEEGTDKEISSFKEIEITSQFLE